jgi:hypothetical protein
MSKECSACENQGRSDRSTSSTAKHHDAGWKWRASTKASGDVRRGVGCMKNITATTQPLERAVAGSPLRCDGMQRIHGISFCWEGVVICT